MRSRPSGIAKPLGLCRGVFALAGAVAMTAGGVLAAPARAADTTVAASQPLVVLLHDHVARTWPGVKAPRIESIDARRPLTRVRTVLPVIGRATSSDGRAWVRVRLPGRPNGRHGWIPAARTRPATTAWRIVVDLSARGVTVYGHGRVVRRFTAVIGKPATPTPLGFFFIEEAMALAPAASGGPFALATSARSNVLQEFAGGPGQVALHGTNHLADALGTAASHGCVRLSTRAITWLAQHIGAGVPLTITR